MLKRLYLLVSVLALVGAMLLLPNGEVFATSKGNFVMGTVVKSIAFNWFMRMEEGVKQFGKD